MQSLEEFFRDLKELNNDFITRNRELLDSIVQSVRFGNKSMVLDEEIIKEQGIEKATDASGQEVWYVPCCISKLEAYTDAVWEGDEDGEYYGNVDMDVAEDFEDAIESTYSETFNKLPLSSSRFTIEEIIIVDTRDVTLSPEEVISCTTEESGIGRYEYWGTIGHDYDTYTTIEGTAKYVGDADINLKVKIK